MVNPDDYRKSETAYRTIGEASHLLMLPAHVLRFWETQFSQLRPMKRSGGRRYYGSNELKLLKVLKYFIRDQDLSIKDTKNRLSELNDIDELIDKIEKKSIQAQDNSSIQEKTGYVLSDQKKQCLNRILSRLEQAKHQLTSLIEKTKSR